MRKYLFIIALFTSSIVSAQNDSASWTEFAQHNYANLENISYTLHRTIHFANGEERNSIASVYADTDNFYFNETNDTTLLHIRNDSLWLIEYAYANISYGPREYETRGINMYYQIQNNYSWQVIDYAPFYFSPGKTSLHYTFKEKKDTMIGDVSFSIMEFSRQASWAYNKGTGKCDIPITDYIWLYCNNQSYWVDKIVVSNTSDCSGQFVVYEFKDINILKQDDTALSNYRMQNPKYNSYAKYDFTKEHAPSVIGKGSNNTLLSDEILQFPLVNEHNDTVRLADTKGWILLDFWIYGCAPCANFWAELQREQDSLGYRRLERNGIQLFCINNEGGVTGKFIDYTKRFHAQDIMYSARGLQKLATITAPTYYLFSPSHNLVYHGYAEHIIDTVLNAKKRYELEHNAKTKKINKGAVISFEYNVYDYGDIEEGGDGESVFIVRNDGDIPLLIDHISSTCGCTTADYPKKPIAPGKTGKIIVKYNTSELGSFRKTILVVSNAWNETKTILQIKGRVVKKK